MANDPKLQKYVNLLINLLPKGRLWNPVEQPNFMQLLRSSAQELCRVDDRVQQMFKEIDPTTTFESVDQWQEVLALPDECSPEDQSLDEIRTQILQKLTNIGGLSKTFYEFVGAQLGFDITVENRVNFLAGRARAGDPLSNYFERKFVAGSTAGTFLTEVGWRYYFNVEMPVTAAESFVAGSVVGTPLKQFSNELIECTMKKLKPAHAGVTFTFS